MLSSYNSQVFQQSKGPTPSPPHLRISGPGARLMQLPLQSSALIFLLVLPPADIIYFVHCLALH